MEFKNRPWHVPHPDRATEGWIEGRPTEAMIAAAREESQRRRAAWRPDSSAWEQLVALQVFVGRRVRIQFWDPIMIMLEEEGPYPVRADCRGLVTLRDDGFLQPYLLLEKVAEETTSDGCSPKSYLLNRRGFAQTLAPVAELCEIEEVTAA